MYCKECGQELNSTATFCKYCGSSQPSSSKSQDSLGSSQQSSVRTEEIISNNTISEVEISVEEQTKMIRKHKIFYSDDEVLIDTLGSGFLSSLFVNEDFRKSVLICSNKRVYLRGKLFEKQQGRIIYVQGEQSVDLKNITGIRYYVGSPVYRLLPIVFFLFLGTITFAFGQELSGNLGNTLRIIAGFIVGSAIISLIIYSLKKRKWFEIQYAGGSIITYCNWYPKRNIQQFMRNVSLQKDKINESDNN